MEEDFVDARPTQVLAAIGVVGVAVVLAVLPALIALRIEVATRTFGQVAVGIASLAVVVGGAKWAAGILGAARVALHAHERVSPASID